MGIRPCSKLLSATGVLIVLCAAMSTAASDTYPEHEVKAAFLYNFMRFTDWPQEKAADTNKPMSIFVIGEYPPCKTFENIQKKNSDPDAKKSGVKVHFFDSYKQIKDPNILKTAYVVFVCESEKKHSSKILETIKDSHVLTVGEHDGFLEEGGIIKFVRHQGRIRFEINLQAATEQGLQLRSKLLRLAKRVITESDEN